MPWWVLIVLWNCKGPDLLNVLGDQTASLVSDCCMMLLAHVTSNYRGTVSEEKAVIELVHLMGTMAGSKLVARESANEAKGDDEENQERENGVGKF